MLQLICSYLFYPFALVMGVETADCRRVGTLLGVKTFLNEFVAYDQLSKLIKNKVLMTEHLSLNGTFDYLGRDIVLNSFNGTADSLTLISGVITVRFTDTFGGRKCQISKYSCIVFVLYLDFKIVLTN